MGNAAVATTVNPITLEVIRNKLTAMLGEIETNLQRTAYSPIVYEVHDYCVSLYDADVRMITQGTGGLPIFLADLGSVIQDGLDIYGKDGFSPGDIIISNHAYTSGQHLNNVTLYTPLFFRDELIAFAAIRAHWLDLGGKWVGNSTDTTEIYQEGIQLRTIKVYKKGVFDAEIGRVIRHNSRFPDQVMGDMRAQIAGCKLAEQRFTEMLERYGKDTVFECVHSMWAQSEERSRQAIAKLPDGTYEAESFLDNDGIEMDRNIPIKVKVVISGSNVRVDFTGTGKQVKGSMNCGYSGGLAAAKVAHKCITSPETLADEGCFKNLEIVLPMGTCISAQEPAALGLWSTHLPTVIDTVLRALSQAVPEKIPAAHHGDLGACNVVGWDPEQKRRFAHVDSQIGGWGASASDDGPSPMKSLCHGDTYNVAVEAEEANYPYLIDYYRLRQDSGGAGQFRGGLGIERRYSFPTDVEVKVAFDRNQCPPWGLHGGKPGLTNGAIVCQGPGLPEKWVQKVTGLPIKAGGHLIVLRGGGGGYGDVAKRPSEAIERDLNAGYISVERARADYGVTVDPETLSIDKSVPRKPREVSSPNRATPKVELAAGE